MKPPVSEEHKVLCQQYAELLIEPLRKVARDYGYALAVHGSLARDIDLIAVPWVDTAGPEPELACAIQKEAKRICGQARMGWSMMGDAKFSLNGCPGNKPHGRLGWIFNLDGGPYIDLSIMPRQITNAEPDE